MTRGKKNNQETDSGSKNSLVKAIIRSDWSTLNGVTIGLVVACVLFFVSPQFKSSAPFCGAVVAGCIARKDGWIAGTLLGLISFVTAAYIMSRIWPEYVRLFKTSPYFNNAPLSQIIGGVTFIVPACAVGGLLGGALRRVMMKIAEK